MGMENSRVGSRLGRQVMKAVPLALMGVMPLFPAIAAAAQIPEPPTPPPIELPTPLPTIESTSPVKVGGIPSADDASLGAAAPGGSEAPQPGSGSARERPGSGPVAQPQTDRPRIAVRKSNDANEDGTFSRSENASEPHATVRFRVEIENVGDEPAEVERITDSYRVVTVEVCDRLVGDRLSSGQTMLCEFDLEDYAPDRFDSVANTVSVVVSAADDNGRRSSERAVSTVTTPGDGGGTQVLGEQVTQEAPAGDPGAGEPPRPALTGMQLLPLASSALALALLGGLFLTWGRRIERAAARVPS